MKHLYYTYLFVILMSMTWVRAYAHDFEMMNSDGVTIYYNYTGGSTGSSVYVTYRGTYYYSYSNEYSGNVAIPKTVTYNSKTYSVTGIGDYAFEGCSGLTSITIPNSVTSIGGSAFSGCSGLTSVIVNGNNPKYDSRENCNAIIETQSNKLLLGCKNTTIPNSVTSIGDYAFDGCSGLTSVTIPESVTSIGVRAFYLCSGLTSVTIPESVTSIGVRAFGGCSGLTSITIPNSVTNIGDYAFNACNGLASIIVNGNNPKYDSRENCNAIIETQSNKLLQGCKNTTIPNSVTSIEEYAFYGCIGLTSITIPNSVTSIGDAAFSYCYGLTSITIPNSVTSIGDEAFYYCIGLTSITIPNSVTNIGDVAFGDCSGLTSITIPNSVTNIGDVAFGDCSGLTSITCLAITPPECNPTAFNSVEQSECTLYVSSKSITAYKNTEVWKNFNIVGIKSTANGDLLRWSFDLRENRSDADKIISDSINWTFQGRGRYQNANDLNDEPLMANGEELTFAKGLRFTTGSKKVLVGCRDQWYLQAYGDIKIIIPSCTKGDSINLSLSLSGAQDRLIGADNVIEIDSVIHYIEGEPTIKKRTVVVKEDGDVTLRLQSGLRIHSIDMVEVKYAVGDANGDLQIDVADFTTIANYILGNFLTLIR